MSPFEVVVHHRKEKIVLSVSVGKSDEITGSVRLLKLRNKGAYNEVDESSNSASVQLLATYHCVKTVHGYLVTCISDSGFISRPSGYLRRIVDCQMFCINDYCSYNNMTPLHKLGMKGE